MGNLRQVLTQIRDVNLKVENLQTFIPPESIPEERYFSSLENLLWSVDLKFLGINIYTELLWVMLNGKCGQSLRNLKIQIENRPKEIAVKNIIGELT